MLEVKPMFVQKLIKLNIIFWGFSCVLTASASIQHISFTETQYQKLSQNDQKSIAKVWGITSAEYLAYLQLMQKTASGKWYKQLNPAEVLGVNAKDAKERMHFAKIVVRNAHARVDKELKFQHAYDAAQKLLYPNQKPIMLPHMQGIDRSAMLKDGDVLLLFTDLNNSYATHLLNRLSTILKAHIGVKLNIYIVGKNISNNAIRAWAISNHLSETLVRKNVITLNHDKGRFKKIALGNKELPLLILKRADNFKQIQISSIW